MKTQLMRLFYSILLLALSGCTLARTELGSSTSPSTNPGTSAKAWYYPADLGSPSVNSIIDVYADDFVRYSMARDSSGNVIVAWVQDDGVANRIYKSEYRNGAWTHPSGLGNYINPSGAGASNPIVKMDSNGNAIIIWQQEIPNGTYSLFKSEYRNGAWTHPTSINDYINPVGVNSVSRIALDMDDDGNALIVWEQSDDNNQQIFRSEYRNSAWTHPADYDDNISPDGQDAQNMKVAMDNNGNALIVWEQSDGAENHIYKSEYRSGAWTDPADLNDYISPLGGNASNPQVVMSDQGSALIAWEQFDGSFIQTFKSDYRSGAWTDPADLSDNISLDGKHVQDVQVAMDNLGRAIIIWGQRDDDARKVFKSEYRNGAWTHPIDDTDHMGFDGSHVADLKVEMDRQGNAIIVWIQRDGGGDERLYKSEYFDGTWKAPADLTEGVSILGADTYAPLVLPDQQGNWTIAWTQYDLNGQKQIFFAE